MKQFRARVESNPVIASGYHRLVFTWPQTVEAPLPGQFISIKSFGTSDLILRRPFAVSAHHPQDGTAEIIYQKRGKATTMLAEKVSGESIDVIGPLGNRFPIDDSKRTILVGGGVGLGPILFFGSWLAAHGSQPTVVLGFRTSAYVPALIANPEELAFDPVVCSDDGSLGFQGTTVDWLRSTVRREPERFQDVTLHACGPNAMMAACSRFCADLAIPCWVSMEQIMGCGVGACIGCAIPVRGASSFARVCTDGPVFDARQIQWERMQ